MKNDESTIVADTAYMLLKEIADESCLRQLADAVGESGIPDTQVTKLFLSKLLFSKELYTGCENMADLVAGVNRQGLYRRPFPNRAKRRAEAGGKRRERVAGLTRKAENLIIDASAQFRKAMTLVEPRLMENWSAAYVGLIRTGQSEWVNAYNLAKARLEDGKGIADAVMEALVNRRTAANGGVSLIPVDRYLALVLAMLPYERGIEALKAVARMTRNNLAGPAVDGRPAPSIGTLPVSKYFVKNCIEEIGSGYRKEYYDRHGVSVWDDMFSAYSFSLVGRAGNPSVAATDMLINVTRVLDDEARGNFIRYDKTVPVFCAIRKDTKDTFGYRTAVFAVYESKEAEKLASRVIEARQAFIGRHRKKESILAQLMKRDLLVQGVSVSSAMPKSEMGKFAGVFGRQKLW